MNQIWIETFLTVVRLGNITAAARHLFLSQSTVSHRLAQLEEQLGVELVERRKGVGNISLTSGGERFLKIAIKWEELYRESRSIKSESSIVTLSIGAVDSVNAYVLGPVYQALRQYSPRLNLRIRNHQSQELYSLLEHKEIDLAFPLTERSIHHYSVEKFFEEPMVLIKMREEGESEDLQVISNDQLDPHFEL